EALCPLVREAVANQGYNDMGAMKPVLVGRSRWLIDHLKMVCGAVAPNGESSRQFGMSRADASHMTFRIAGDGARTPGPASPREPPPPDSTSGRTPGGRRARCGGLIPNRPDPALLGGWGRAAQPPNCPGGARGSPSP